LAQAMQPCRAPERALSRFSEMELGAAGSSAEPIAVGSSAAAGSSQQAAGEREPSLRSCLARWRSELDGWPPLLPRRLAPEIGEERRPDDLRVLGFNLLADGKQGEEQWECTPPGALEWERCRWRLLEELTVHGPDVLLLQEVDAQHFECFFRPELSRAGYSGVFAQMPNSRPDGVAVFWSTDRFSPLSTEGLELQASAQVALAATLESRELGPGRFVVASAHLKSGKDEASERARQAQVEELLGRLQELAAGAPVVLAADFNTEPGASAESGPALALPAALRHPLGLCSAYPAAPYTTWKRRPKGEVCRVIDYVLFSQAQLRLVAVLDVPAAEEVPSERLPCFRYPSDHVALMAVLRPH